MKAQEEKNKSSNGQLSKLKNPNTKEPGRREVAWFLI